MRTDELARLYASKTDEELLRLASQRDELTAEASTVLNSELSHRRIARPEIQDDDRQDQGRSGAYPDCKDLETGPFIGEVIRLYHQYLWYFFALLFPAALVGYIAVFSSRQEARELARHAFLKPETVTEATVLQVSLINLAGVFVSWMAFAFCFAAICCVVEQIESHSALSIGDSITEVLRQSGRFLWLSFLLFGLCLVAFGASFLTVGGLIWAATQFHTHLSGTAIWLSSVVSGGLALLLLCRLSLAMPCVIVDDYKVIKAMFRSDELTRGKWSILAILLAKSLIGGYLAALAPFWIVSWVSRMIELPSWVGWGEAAASVAGTAMVEPYMFVGFALLYLRTSEKTESDQHFTGQPKVFV
jgi:hypothetical protein